MNRVEWKQAGVNEQYVDTLVWFWEARFHLISSQYDLRKISQSVATHQRTEAGPRQRHGEGCHGNGAEVKDSGIDVQRGESLRWKRDKHTYKSNEIRACIRETGSNE